MKNNSNTLWQQLVRVQSLLSETNDSLYPSLTAKVEVSFLATDRIVWHEQGHWIKADGSEGPKATNRYLWQAQQKQINLSHIRFGEQQPVLLAQFDCSNNDDCKSSLITHPCGEDSYHATLTISQSYLQLNWKITGPAKNISLQSRYFFAK